MKLVISVPEVINIFKEIKKQPEQLYEIGNIGLFILAHKTL
jgi:hypothetical protein